jgi:glycosyltransferase involved in cell wall biosynthesis
VPRFSVIVPVYNRAATVLPTLESVRDQTFADFECIVIDDGSIDGEQLREIVESLADARFRYVRRENGGGSAARNTGIDEANGEFVAFLDSDDRWLREKLERDVEVCGTNRVVFSRVLVERRGRIVGQRPRTAPRPGEPIPDYLACRDGFTQTSTIVLPTLLARRVRFNEEIAFSQDMDFAIRLAAAGAEFEMLPQSAVIMLDDETGDRLSRSKDWRGALAWVDGVRPMLSDRAYHAYRGRQVARLAADSGKYATALRYYMIALARRAFSPRLAAKALGQLLVRGDFYRRIRG